MSKLLSIASGALVGPTGKLLHMQGGYGPTAGLVGGWKLNNLAEGTTDVVGANNATLNGGMGYGSSDGREYAVFADADDYVSIPHSADFNLGTGDCSLACWVKTTDTGQSFFIDRWCDADTDNQLSLYMYLGYPTFFTYEWPNASYRTGSVIVNDGLWHHLCGVRYGSNIDLYTDGVLTNGVGVTTPRNFNGTGPFTFGRFTGGGYNLTGTMSDVRFYHRALSAIEIAWLATIRL